MDEDIKQEIKGIIEEQIGKEYVFENEPMSLHTSFRTGGPADLYVIPQKAHDLTGIVSLCVLKKIPYILFGNGSNTLVTDKGIRGVVISLKGLNKIDVHEDEGYILVDAGVQVIKLSMVAQEHGLSGLEFACGIPGTVGGAIFMNAGAYGGEFKDVTTLVKYFDAEKIVERKISNEECEFGYRSSVFQKMERPIILQCRLDLKKGDKNEILSKMKENMESRNSKQPVNLPSAGSTFKREEGIIVAKLIDEAGLKGYKIGGAEVSTLHAGFIVNSGNATSKDILDLIEYVKKVIKEKNNVDLHEEIKIVGER